MSNHRLILIVIIFFFAGCGGGIKQQKIFGEYYLTAVDYVKSNTSLSYRLKNGDFIGIIGEMVDSVGYNENFFIVKQHPLTNLNSYDTNTTNYYIVPIYKEFAYDLDKNIIGPLDKEKLVKHKNQLGMDSVRFSVSLF